MEEKNKYVETYIINIGEQLARNGIKITDNQLSRVINRFSNSDKSIEEIQKEINDLLNEFLENYSKMMEAKQLQDLQVPFNGITLNNQDIDLMLIAGANNPQELQDALSKITNIRLSLNTTELTEEQFKVFYVLGCGCFCCLYAKHKYLQTTDNFFGVVNFKCEYCPLSWGDNKKDTCFSIDEDDEEDGLYENWSYMIEHQQYDKAYELALKIRDLPLRN